MKQTHRFVGCRWIKEATLAELLATAEPPSFTQKLQQILPSAPQPKPVAIASLPTTPLVCTIILARLIWQQYFNHDDPEAIYHKMDKMVEAA